jgi:protein-S-isoprenylcysteine O-methyltransferase Ste14
VIAHAGPRTIRALPRVSSLGEIVAIAGVALQYLSAWALLLLALVCAFQLQRMKYEERVLFQVFPKYGDYMAQTARLMPGVY